MSQVAQEAVIELHDIAFQHFVKSSLAAYFGNANRIVAIDRKLSDYHSSFAIEDLAVTFESGERLPLVFKNLSPDALLGCARQIRPSFTYHPQREVDVYRRILAGSGLGTPICFGAVADPHSDRYWLLLEKVSGLPLAKTGEFSSWCDVARWLAQFHSAMGDVAVHPWPVANLFMYNEGSFGVWIERAERFCSLHARVGTNTLPNAVGPLAEICRRAVRFICQLPQTFIHGEFYASNILIGVEQDGTRICVLDWETAAIGPALLDLAALVAGDWPEERRTELALAYYNELPPKLNIYGSVETFFIALCCCRLFLAIKWLGWSSDWQAPDEHRWDWLAEATEMAKAIESI